MKSFFHRTPKLLLVFPLFLVLAGCGIFDQASEIRAFSRCEFRLSGTEDVRLAGVPFDNVNSLDDLNVIEIARITGGVAAGDLPLELTLLLDIRNPNTRQAALNALDWILYIDGHEITRGGLSRRITVAPLGDVERMPLGISVNLYKIMEGGSGNALINLALNLSGQGQVPSRVLLKAKPVIYISGKPVAYPGYINIRNEFTSR
ncbi:MAG: hypothetical protein R6T99_09465 [Bacteroidales bacterium]